MFQVCCTTPVLFLFFHIFQATGRRNISTSWLATSTKKRQHRRKSDSWLSPPWDTLRGSHQLRQSLLLLRDPVMSVVHVISGLYLHKVPWNWCRLIMDCGQTVRARIIFLALPMIRSLMLIFIHAWLWSRPIWNNHQLGPVSPPRPTSFQIFNTSLLNLRYLAISLKTRILLFILWRSGLSILHMASILSMLWSKMMLNRMLCFSNLAKSDVVGIIEIGLDYMHAERRADLPDTKDRQYQMLKKILLETRKMLAFASMPLAMHIRDITSYWEEAHLDTIKILQECGVDPTHPIYLHCFVGSARVVQAWMDAYPEVKFGISPKVLVSGHHKDLPQVFRDVPFTRLLVEADSNG